MSTNQVQLLSTCTRTQDLSTCTQDFPMNGKTSLKWKPTAYEQLIVMHSHALG